MSRPEHIIPAKALLTSGTMAVLLALAAVLPLSPTAASAQDLGTFITEKLKGLMGQDAPTGPRRIVPQPGTDKAKAVRTKVSGPHAVPLPRPRPPALRKGKGAGGSARTAAGTMPPTAPIVVENGGQVTVAPERLGKERDPYRAVYLKPKEAGRWPQNKVKAARQRCEVVLATTNLDARPLSPIGGPKGCGVAAPIAVRALGAVALKPTAKLNCTFAAALYRWVTDVVQPAARRHFGQPVVAIRQLSSYACRRRGGITRGPVRISEHAFGNAIDVAAFELADGRRVSVLKDWGSFSALFNRKAAFLKEVHRKACGIFSTVLGPEANRAHRNHFHFDLGRGGRYKYCR